MAVTHLHIAINVCVGRGKPMYALFFLFMCVVLLRVLLKCRLLAVWVGLCSLSCDVALATYGFLPDATMCCKEERLLIPIYTFHRACLHAYTW